MKDQISHMDRTDLATLKIESIYREKNKYKK